MRSTISTRVFHLDPLYADPNYHFTVEPLSDNTLRARRCHLRMTILLIATLIMGFCDLAFTLTYMTSVGMVEVNPLARLVVSVGNVPALVIFKVALMIMSAAMLYLARGNRMAEPIAWACTFVLLALMIHWLNYNQDIPSLTNEMAVLAMDGGTGSYIRVGS